MIPTYHCADYVGQTLRSVLDQDPGPDAMEVVVVDDRSTADDPEPVVRDVAGTRVRFVRQEHNLGHVRTFNRCLSMARGHRVHLLHGDDWVEPGFYAAADHAFDSQPDLAAFVCRYRYADPHGAVRDGPRIQEQAGVSPGWLELLGQGQRLQAPSTAVRRAVYERVGGFDEGIVGYGEDWEMWLRVAAAGPVWWDPSPLAVYRIRAGSLSDRARLKSNMDDMWRVIALNAGTLAEHLPPQRAEELTAAARRALGQALLRRAARALDEGDLRSPLPFLTQAMRFWPHPTVLTRGGKTLARWGRVRAQRQF